MADAGLKKEIENTILKDSGAGSWSPEVVDLLVDFKKNLARRILTDAKDFATHRSVVPNSAETLIRINEGDVNLAFEVENRKHPGSRTTPYRLGLSHAPVHYAQNSPEKLAPSKTGTRVPSHCNLMNDLISSRITNFSRPVSRGTPVNAHAPANGAGKGNKIDSEEGKYNIVNSKRKHIDIELS